MVEKNIITLSLYCYYFKFCIPLFSNFKSSFLPFHCFPLVLLCTLLFVFPLPRVWIAYGICWLTSLISFEKFIIISSNVASSLFTLSSPGYQITCLTFSVSHNLFLSYLPFVFLCLGGIYNQYVLSFLPIH